MKKADRRRLKEAGIKPQHVLKALRKYKEGSFTAHPTNGIPRTSPPASPDMIVECRECHTTFNVNELSWRFLGHGAVIPMIDEELCWQCNLRKLGWNATEAPPV